jgi:hypothetical protein
MAGSSNGRLMTPGDAKERLRELGTRAYFEGRAGSAGLCAGALVAGALLGRATAARQRGDRIAIRHIALRCVSAAAPLVAERAVQWMLTDRRPRTARPIAAPASGRPDDQESSKS